MKIGSKAIMWSVVVILLIGGVVSFVLSARETVVPTGSTLRDAREFEEYYREEVPGKIAIWEASAHGQNDVTCINCHGKETLSEENLKFSNFGLVEPETCGECHEKEYEGFKETRHVKAVEFSKKNMRYHLLDGFPAMQQQGCDCAIPR